MRKNDVGFLKIYISNKSFEFSFVSVICYYSKYIICAIYFPTQILIPVQNRIRKFFLINLTILPFHKLSQIYSNIIFTDQNMFFDKFYQLLCKLSNIYFTIFYLHYFDESLKVNEENVVYLIIPYVQSRLFPYVEPRFFPMLNLDFFRLLLPLWIWIFEVYPIFICLFFHFFFSNFNVD